MADNLLVDLSFVLIVVLFFATHSEQSKQDKFRKRVDEKMHTHAADDVQGIGGWY
jgi:hypothetical protein